MFEICSVSLDSVLSWGPYLYSTVSTLNSWSSENLYYHIV